MKSVSRFARNTKDCLSTLRELSGMGVSVKFEKENNTEDKLVFVVEKGQGNIAVGKKGEHVIKLKDMTGKNIQVVEYSDDPQQFVMNVFHIYNPQKVVIEQRGNITHATVTVDPKLKGRAIGKAGKNLRIARDIVNRHHDIQSLSVD